MTSERKLAMCMKNGKPQSAQKASAEGPRLDIVVQRKGLDGRSPDFTMSIFGQCSEEEEKVGIAHSSASKPEVPSQ